MEKQTGFRRSVKAFEAHADKYFSDDKKQPTMNGFARHMELSLSRLKDYPRESEFYEVIQNAISRIAISVEELAIKRDPIHWLKANQPGWVVTERQQIETDGGLKINISSDNGNNIT